MDFPCEVPDGVKGFILFHFLRKQKISQYNSIISLEVYFTCYKLKEVRMAESKLRELSTDFAVKNYQTFFSEINPKGFVKYLSV